MRSILTFALALFVFYTGLNLAARLQVHEQAKLIDKSGQVFEGRMSRDILTGDYRIDSPSSVGEVRIIPKEQIGGLVYVESDGLPWQSTVTMYGTIVLMLLLFGYDIFRSMRKSSALLLGPRTRCSFPNDLPMAVFYALAVSGCALHQEGKPFPSYSHL
jgi:hypothetical protein